MIDKRYLCDCINRDVEFSVLKYLSRQSKVDYLFLSNFALDHYNWECSRGVDKFHSKYLALMSTINWVYKFGDVK